MLNGGPDSLLRTWYHIIVYSKTLTTALLIVGANKQKYACSVSLIPGSAFALSLVTLSLKSSLRKYQSIQVYSAGDVALWERRSLLLSQEQQVTRDHLLGCPYGSIRLSACCTTTVGRVFLVDRQCYVLLYV